MEKQIIGKSFLVDGKTAESIGFEPSMMTRHGVIAGATGTGKTMTVRILVEKLSALGVPTFLADVKGDLTGIAKSGVPDAKISPRMERLNIPAEGYFQKFPVTLWDAFGVGGIPFRVTISEIGPTLLARLLELNEVQTGVLQVAFRVADEEGLLLLDLKDLRSLLTYLSENAKTISAQFGNISPTSVAAIQRNLLSLEDEGAENFFAEPAIHIDDFFTATNGGVGMVNILAAEKLLEKPKTYASLLMYVLSELYETLPEVGDVEVPKLVFFFDEAHLLFDDCPAPLLQKIEQVVRLIRSKGVGVFFISQSITDIPSTILAQLGNRVQHAVRAFTEKDRKAIKTVAQNFRGEGLDVADALTSVSVGEAVVSLLEKDGTPAIAKKVLIYPPKSSVSPLTTSENNQCIRQNLLFEKYAQAVDRDSAFELLAKRKQPPLEAQPPAFNEKTSNRQGILGAFLTSTARAIGSQVGRSLVRGIMDSLVGGTTRRRK